MCTTNGARSLGLHVGKIEAGFGADRIADDLSAPCLDTLDQGSLEDALMNAVVCGAGGAQVVKATCMNGVRRDD